MCPEYTPLILVCQVVFFGRCGEVVAHWREPRNDAPFAPASVRVRAGGAHCLSGQSPRVCATARTQTRANGRKGARCVGASKVRVLYKRCTDTPEARPPERSEAQASEAKRRGGSRPRKERAGAKRQTARERGAGSGAQGYGSERSERTHDTKRSGGAVRSTRCIRASAPTCRAHRLR